jgi:Family of unknown function (DUF5947)
VSSSNTIPDASFATLRQFARKRKTNVESCEMCSRELGAEHQHLLEPASRKLVCACDACAILFSGSSDLKFKRVPRDVRFLSEFRMSDGQWDSLMIPIEMAFLYYSTPHAKVVAYYPSPAGATESLLALDTWNDVTQENPALQHMQTDVEALLVNRIGAGRGVAPEFYIVPIDECYRLVGLIRMHWRGLSGGTEVWREVGKYFGELKSKAGVLVNQSSASGAGEEAHA